jgi:two-component system response regulator (stage 0 sporulation protein F)
LKILIVDDEIWVRELLEEFLTLQGYQVTLAPNGEEALKKFNQDRPDIVLLDIKMPGISGLEVLGRIKRLNKKIGVIMLSAFGDFDTIQKALEMGADHFIEKPFDLNRISKILSVWEDLQE